ncbi:MAG TPA: hypothetical protein VFY93_03090 [Planctomycetota bacterium]|nr:hypothetical protein [Planctomycetota bacterium]
MSCRFEEEVLLLRDGFGDRSRRLVVEAHLARCPGCARIDEALELVQEHLRRADDAPLGMVVHLPPRRRRLPAALAAAVALVAAVWLGWPAPPPALRTTHVVLPPEPPRLPPPGAARGPGVADLVAALEPGADDYPAQVAAVAARVRADGVAGTAALAEMLGGEDPRPALAVAAETPSPLLAAALETFVMDPELARPAVRALAAGRSVKGLVGALDGPAAAAARDALVGIGGREAADAFERSGDLDALAQVDPARAARVCASATAGKPGAGTLARLLPELRRLLSDDRYAAGAARRLGEARDPAARDELAGLALRPATAREATEALLSLGSFEAAFAAARRARGAREAFDGARGAEAFLLARIDRGPYAERRAALELLARCGGEATVRRLATAAVPRNLMDAAAAALGAIGGAEAIDALDRMRGERAVRRDVVRALGATGDPRALPVLRKLAGEDGLASDLCAALGRIGDAECADMLADLALRGGAAEEAARVLTGMPAPVVVPVLLDRLGGKGRARELLVRIAGKDHGPRPESWKQWWDSRP